MTWKLIASAPLDEPVLLFSPDAREPGVMIGIRSTFVGADSDDLIIDWSDFWEERELDVEPTHWMPLPERPER
jgi:hypothetical protein